ncbi:MAG: alpha-glucan family phosphorylase [Myxococcota bacterium]
MTRQHPSVAYFSMEIGLHADIPTYSGGLGVLAGDTIRSAADLGIDLVGVTLLHRRGYFRQSLDAEGGQQEEAVEWDIEAQLTRVDARASVEIQGRTVHLGAWRYDVVGATGATVPVYLLDADLPENDEEDRTLTDTLYGGDERYRLCQEAILGIGGLRLLRAVGCHDIDRFHLNEGHAALVVLALLDEGKRAPRTASEDEVLDTVRPRLVFTTHTPVSAGHDSFSRDLVRQVLGERVIEQLGSIGENEGLNMTELALRASRYTNGVAMRHAEVSRSMFPGYPIHSITNGIHPETWLAPAMREVFDRHIPYWRKDLMSLRYAMGIPAAEIAAAHGASKKAMMEYIDEAVPDHGLLPGALTIGFARRAASYKRLTLVLRDLERLAAISETTGRIQLVFAGKAHPADGPGKDLIRQVFAAREALRGRVSLVYLPDYDMNLARLLVAGCDVWLNTPLPPLEASGTSGMKAALNGVPSLSVLDGWWVEGNVEGVTGWAIGSDDGMDDSVDDRDANHAVSLYEKLEYAVVPTFYNRPRRFHEMQRSCIALNASFFNTQRMVLQYLYDAYQGPDEG